MDYLRNIIQTLSEEDINNFKTFVNRLKQKEKRRDLQLFHILSLQEEFSPRQIAKKLDDHLKMNAYHSIRKRLTKHLMDFMVTNRLAEDTTASSSVMGLISLSKYLFEKNKPTTAWNYLEKAEQKAIDNEHYDLLNTIYNLQIEQTTSNTKKDLYEIISLRNQNKQLADEEEKVNIASSMVKQQILEYKLNGENVDFNQVVKSTLKQYGLSKTITARPKLTHKIVQISRGVALATKQYHEFEPFIIKQYQKIESRSEFAPKDHFYKLSFLYMISHTLYRNKKFKQSEHYLETLYIEASKYKRNYWEQFYPKYIMLLSAVKSYQGNNEDALTFLQNEFDKNKHRLSHEDELNILLNLALYYFQNNDAESALDILLSNYHTDHWCAKVVGKEWVLKKNLMEAILHYELANPDMAITRIRTIERNLGDILSQKPYERVKVFIGLVKQVISKPDIVSQQSFEDKIEYSFEWLPMEEEDIQAMSFYAWLKSKITKKDYYEVLLLLVKG